MQMNGKPRQLPKLGEQSSQKVERAPTSHNDHVVDNQVVIKKPKPEKASSTAFRANTGSVIGDDDEKLIPPRAQKFNRFLGQQIRIEISNHQVDEDQLKQNHADSKNLLFYDFNAGARKFNFGLGGNTRIATRGEFRRTGMAGAKFGGKNQIEPTEIEKVSSKRRPITSHFR